MSPSGPKSPLEPITKQLTVPLPPEAAFDLFTEHMGAWWPFESHSIYEGRHSGFVFECRPGGRIVETGPNGEESVWGTARVFHRPAKLVITWHPGRDSSEATEYAVTFAAAADGAGTLVTLVHTGFEILGDRAEAVHANYDTGWDVVFGERFGGAARG